MEFDGARLKRFQANKKLSDDWEEHVKLVTNGGLRLLSLFAAQP